MIISIARLSEILDFKNKMLGHLLTIVVRFANNFVTIVTIQTVRRCFIEILNLSLEGKQWQKKGTLNRRKP